MRLLLLFILISLFVLQGCSIHARQVASYKAYQDSLASIDASFIKKYDSIYLTATNINNPEVTKITAEFACKEYNESTVLSRLVDQKLIGRAPACVTDKNSAQGKVLHVEISRPASGKSFTWGSSLETTLSYEDVQTGQVITSTTLAYTTDVTDIRNFFVGHVTNLLILAYTPDKGSPQYPAWAKRYKDVCGSPDDTVLCDK